jgi:hypothetical protein
MALTLNKIRLKQKRVINKTEIMNYKEIEEIKKEMFLNGNLQREARFECYCDEIFTYHLYDNNDENDGFWEFCIINKEADFFDKEKVCDLLDLQHTQFFSTRYFGKLDKIVGGHELFKESCKTFRLSDYIEDKSALN